MNTTQTDQAERRRAFRKALIDEEITAAAFARERLRITSHHLRRAFTDPPMVAARIHEAIDALIAKHGGRAQ
ncbi:MAG: hypothetical protein IT356_12515 [Gemmatimonadaceae bacterium]|nr:hypothetical protein [Gemmatimonadaceae bacterium]